LQADSWMNEWIYWLIVRKGGRDNSKNLNSKTFFEKEALQFITYLAKPENHDKFAAGVPFLSPRLAAKLDFGVYQSVYEVFQDELANTPAENVLDWQNMITVVGIYPVSNTGIEACMGGDDPKETLERLAAEIDALVVEQGLK